MPQRSIGCIAMLINSFSSSVKIKLVYHRRHDYFEMNMAKNSYPVGEHALLIPGPAGQLEAILTIPEIIGPKVIGLVCHPHPLHGGTMNNKVVNTVCRSLREVGIINLRFNFRGVGKSTGEFADGIGETGDASACISWLQHQWPEAKLWLVGFSFGAYVAYKTSLAVASQCLVCIAPPVHHYDFASLALPSCPWWVLQPDADEIVPVQQVLAWINNINPKPQLIRFAETSHFFHGKLIILRQTLIDIWRNAIAS